MNKFKLLISLVILFALGYGGYNYINQTSDIELTSEELNEPSFQQNQLDSTMPEENPDINLSVNSDLNIPEIKEVEIEIPEIEVIEIVPIELTDIRLPQTEVILPEIKQLKTPEFKEESMPLEYQDPGSAESVTAGADNTIQSSGVRTLKVDPQVIQSVEQQTGIPSSDIEQAFTKD